MRVLRDHSLSYAVLLPLSTFHPTLLTYLEPEWMDENRVELMLNSHVGRWPLGCAHYLWLLPCLGWA